MTKPKLTPASSWTRVADRCVHNLHDFATADRLREKMLGMLERYGRTLQYRIKVRKYPLRACPNVPTTFSVLVYKRSDTVDTVTGGTSYVIGNPSRQCPCGHVIHPDDACSACGRPSWCVS